MKYSLFTPKGLHEYRAGKPIAEVLYDTATALWAERPADQANLCVEPGSLVDLFCFTLARALARAHVSTRKLNGERHPTGAYYLLDDLEREYGLVPAPGDTLRTRREALGGAFRVARGCSRPELEAQLLEALGDDYAGVHVPDPGAGEVVAWPPDLGDQPQLLLLPTVRRKLARLAQPVSTDLGVEQEVTYTPVDPTPTDDEPTPLSPGDRLVVEPENLFRAEVVTVLSSSVAGDVHRFSAVFQQAHEPGSWCGQLPFPAWTSSQRAVLVPLAPALAQDPGTVQEIDVLLRRILTDVTVWYVCPLPSATTIGPWMIGDPVLGLLGKNPLGTITV
jgi:hypothetical protein